MSVAGPLGIGRKRAPDLELPELLPGQGFDVEVAVDGVAGLAVATASVDVDPGRAAEGFELPEVTHTSSTLAPPITLLALLLLIVLGALAVRARRRHQMAADAPFRVVVPDQVIDPAGAIDRDHEHQPT